MLLMIEASQPTVNGPLTKARSSVPVSPGPVLKKTWPLKGVEPSPSAARPVPWQVCVLKLITDGLMKKTPQGVRKTPIKSLICSLLSDVNGVWRAERETRLSVPRTSTKVSGAPLARFRIEVNWKPPARRLTQPPRSSHRLPLPKGSSYIPLKLKTCV